LEPPDAEAFARRFARRHPFLHRFKQSLPKELTHILVKDFQNDLQVCPGQVILKSPQEARSTFEHFAAPTIVYDKEAKIHFVNKVYQEMFGFNAKLPTPSEEFTWLKVH
jgi:hypothetical protein